METLTKQSSLPSPRCQIGNVAYGTWSGGRFMHFGETLSEEDYHKCVAHAYAEGIRTFITADVYGNGRADALLGEALAPFPRESYALIGAIGHDFYEGKRQGNTGYPRFTNPELRKPSQYNEFLQMACCKSLENCRTDHFDLLLLHNPDEIGYTSPAVWEGMNRLKQEGLTRQLGIAPGPANGFTLDLVQCFENFGHLIDWAMVILNPLEPWPVSLSLNAASQFEINIITRVLDHGGVFYDELKPDHQFAPGDHRAYRPEGWVKRGYDFVEKIRPLAQVHGLTPLQYAANWNLSHPAVKSVIPTFVQERGENARPIEDKISEMANLPIVQLSEEEVAKVRALGDNTGCMLLKGASNRHSVSERCDEWPMRPDLIEIAKAYNLGTDW
ncbi:MAG: aldo/keto reductase [Verrucomicrobiaceae bacterium]